MKIKRKARYEILGVMLMPKTVEGMMAWRQTHLRTKFPSATHELLYFGDLKHLNKEFNEAGITAFAVKAKVDVHDYRRKGGALVNNMHDRYIGVLAVDELKAYRIAEAMLQKNWLLAHKLNRYKRR